MVVHVMVPPVHLTLRQHVHQTTVAAAGHNGVLEAMKYYVMVRNILIVHTGNNVWFTANSSDFCSKPVNDTGKSNTPPFYSKFINNISF